MTINNRKFKGGVTMEDNLEVLKELVTEDNYSFYTSSSGDMYGSFYSTGIYQLDENTAFVRKRSREDFKAEEKIRQYKVSIDVYNEIFALIKENKLINLVNAPKEEYLAYDMATIDYQIRIGNKNYRFNSTLQIDQKRREIIWEILDLIHLKER
jgi:hypothetical protein